MCTLGPLPDGLGACSSVIALVSHTRGSPWGRAGDGTVCSVMDRDLHVLLVDVDDLHVLLELLPLGGLAGQAVDGLLEDRAG